MACPTITLPSLLVTALGALDGKYVSMISGANFMCEVRGYLVEDMLIGTYRDQVASQLATALFYMSTTIMTIWVVYHGFMIMTGGNRQPILPLFLKTGKIALIMSLVSLIAAKSPIIADWVADFQALITAAIVGSDIDLYQMIDINISLAQVFNALVNGLVGGKQVAADGNQLTTIAGLIGQSGPAVLLSVLSVMAEISIVLAIMLAPLFLMFLLFQQTSAMFWTWVKFLLGTMVSLAVITLVGSIVLDMMMRYGGSVVAAFFVNGMLGAVGVGGGFDIGGSVVQLGALGALSTALLTMVPPLIMQFFNSGASFAAGAMSGAMGGGGAASGMAGMMKSIGGEGGAGAPAIQGGGASGGALGYGGVGGGAGASPVGMTGGGSSMNNPLLQRVASLSGGQSGGAISQTRGASTLQGSRGIAAQSAESPNVAAIQQKQADMGHVGELRLNPKNGVYESTDTARQMAADPSLGRGGSLPVSGGLGAGGTTAATGVSAGPSASTSSSPSAGAGSSSPHASTDAPGGGAGTPTYQGDSTSASAPRPIRSSVSVPYGEGRNR